MMLQNKKIDVNLAELYFRFGNYEKYLPNHLCFARRLFYEAKVNK